MLGSEIISFFRDLVDGDFDGGDDFALNLANTAKNNIELKLMLKILEDENSTQSRSSGDTYLSMKTLPTGAMMILNVVVDGKRQKPIDFKDRIIRKDSANHYYVHWANSQFAICGGAASSSPIYVYFWKNSADLTAAGTPVWPAMFHRMIAFEMARIFRGAVDYDDVTRGMTPYIAAEAKELFNAMRTWDASLKVADMDGQASKVDVDTGYGESGRINFDRD